MGMNEAQMITKKLIPVKMHPVQKKLQTLFDEKGNTNNQSDRLTEEMSKSHKSKRNLSSLAGG